MARWIALLVVLLSAAMALSLSLPAERQTGNGCNQNSDCYPEGLEDVPVAFITCTSQVCSCDACFMFNETSGRCETMPPCTQYNSSTATCTDNRRNQLTAFLLAFFLTWVGAANFYIAQFALAVPQLLLGMLVCFMSCASRIHRAVTKEREEASCLAITCCCAVFSLVLSLTQFAWWLADLIIFGLNNRLDGDGCPLNPNL